MEINDDARRPQMRTGISSNSDKSNVCAVMTNVARKGGKSRDKDKCQYEMGRALKQQTTQDLPRTHYEFLMTMESNTIKITRNSITNQL